MQREAVRFPMTDEEVSAVKAAYNGSLPDFINIQLDRRHFWRGQIWRSADPR